MLLTKEESEELQKDFKSLLENYWYTVHITKEVEPATETERQKELYRILKQKWDFIL
jgi:hypothetical protein